MGMIDFSDQLRKIIIWHKRIGYILFACLVINPITVDTFAVSFDCTPIDQASDSIMTPT